MAMFHCSICDEERMLTCISTCGHETCLLCTQKIFTISMNSNCAFCRASLPEFWVDFEFKFYPVTKPLSEEERRETFITACRIGNVDEAQKLLDLGADPHVVDKEGASSAFFAAQNGHLEILRLLAANGVNVNKPIEDDVTPILIASERGHLPVVKYLHSQGATIDSCSEDKCTPLTSAAQEGHLDVVQYLHSQGADLHNRTNDGATAILIAAENGHTSIVEYLAQSGASVNIATVEHHVPVFMAAQLGNVELMQVLLKYGASLQEPNGEYRLLNVAAQNGRLKMVQFLCEIGMDVTEADKIGNNPLILASEGGYMEIVLYLHSQGADVNASNLDNEHPLFYAAKSGHEEVVEYFCENGSIVNQETHSEQLTALIGATVTGNLQIIKRLINNGAKMNVNSRFSPFGIAAGNGCLDIVKYLHQAGACPNRFSEDGYPPIFLAVAHGHLNVVKYLLSVGVSLDQTVRTNTPFSVALKNRRLDLAMYIAQTASHIEVIVEQNNIRFVETGAGKYVLPKRVFQ